MRPLEAYRQSKRRLFSPSRRVLEHGQRERPKVFSGYCSPVAGRGRELEGKEVGKGVHQAELTSHQIHIVVLA